MILEGPFIQFIISLDLVDGIVISSRNNLWNNVAQRFYNISLVVIWLSYATQNQSVAVNVIQSQKRKEKPNEGIS